MNINILRTTVIAVVFFMAILLFPPNGEAGYLGTDGGLLPDEAQEILDGGDEKWIFIWGHTYPEMIRDGAKWDEYSPNAIKFYLPERRFRDYFSVDSNLQAIQTYMHNSRLVSGFTDVFGSLKHIERATNFTVFQFMVELIAPITFGLWAYIYEYWWQLFFTLGVAYVLVGLIKRKMLWMLIRFGLILVFSGLLIALFGPGFELWDDTLTKVHRGINEEQKKVMGLAVKDAKIEMTGDFATDIGNTMYYLNVMQPFIIGQFGGVPSDETIEHYFSLDNNQKRHKFMDDYLEENRIDTETLMLQRGEISWRMKWVNKFSYVTYAGLGYVSALIEILLVVQIIPLMISLIFASLPTDESLGEVRNRVATMAKLMLGKLVLAFVVSVGTYVNVFLTSKVSLGELSISDAQFLIIITYAGTMFYSIKLLKWIWSSRDYAWNKTKQYGSRTKNLIAGAAKYKIFKDITKNNKTTSKTKRRPRSKPAEKPKQLTPKERIQAAREQSGGRRRTNSVRTTTRSQPMTRRA